MKNVKSIFGLSLAALVLASQAASAAPGNTEYSSARDYAGSDQVTTTTQVARGSAAGDYVNPFPTEYARPADADVRHTGDNQANPGNTEYSTASGYPAVPGPGASSKVGANASSHS
jgi:hypothetical protein